MNKNIKRISSGAAAVVMALTTAVYVPGFANTASAADNEPVACVYSKGATSNVINNDTKSAWTTGNDITLTGTEGCTYEVGTFGGDITIAENANITLTFNAAAAYTGTITNEGALTISGTEVADIVNEGTLTISDITLNDLSASKGTVTIKSGTVKGDVEATGEGKIVITGGTFDGEVTANGKVSATGGTYKISAYADADELEATLRGIRANDTYDAYKISDDYYSLETNIASKGIVFNLSSIAEDVAEEITGAYVEDSNTKFTYTVELVTFSTDAEGKTTETVTEATDVKLLSAADDTELSATDAIENGGKLKIKGDNSSKKDTAYRLTATSTINENVKKSVDFKVTSALTDATITLADDSDDTTDRKDYNTFVHRDDTTDEDGNPVAGTDISEANIFLDENDGSIVFTVAPVTAEASVASYSDAIIVDGAELTDEQRDEFDIADVNFDEDTKTITVAPSKDKPGTFTIRITATATDGTVKSRDLKITVQDVLDTAEPTNNTVYFLETATEKDETTTYSYPTMSAEDFIAKVNPSYTTLAGYPEEEGVSALSDLNYSIVDNQATAYTLETDEETGKVLSITPKAAAKNGASVVIRATDGKSGVEKDINVTIEVVTALEDIEADAIDVVEETTVDTIVTDLINDALDGDDGYESSAYTEKSHSIKFYAANYDETTRTYSINSKKAGSLLSLGTETVDDVEVEVIKAGTGEGTEFAVIEYVADVNGLETSATITYQFNIKAQLSEVTLLDADGKQIDGAVAKKNNWGASATDDLVAGETKTYTIAVKSSSIKLSNVEFSFSGDAVVSAGNFDAGYNTFSVTAGKAGETGDFTVSGKAGNQSFSFTVDVTTAEYEELNQVIADGIYTIAASKDNGYVLDVAGASTKDGANVQLYQDNGTAAQKFVITHLGDGIYSIKNLKSGLYLSTDYAHGNTLVQVAPVEGGNVIDDVTEVLAAMNSAWYAKLNSDSTITFTNKTTGLTLDIAGNTMKNGTDVRGYAGNNTTAQQFVLTAVAEASTNSYHDGTFTITSALGEDLVLDVAGAGTKNGANINLYESNGTKAQRFTLKSVGNDGFYAIVAHTNEDEDHAIPDEDHQDEWLVLDVAGAGTKNGTNVQLYAWNETIAQQWMIVENDDDTITLVSRCNGLVLDIKGAGTKNGTNAQLYTSNGTKAQKFVLKAVED